MIEFEHVTRRYGSKVAVADVSLQIPAGQVFAFLGPNGAGKTTAIKMLVGLLHPSQGRVRVCDCDLAAAPSAAAQRLGYVPDEAFLYDKLTGREFLEFIAEIRGLGKAEIDAAIARQSGIFELDEFLDDLAETYSHGMRQRLVFAAAMLHNPPVLVVDEPMVGLDPRSARLVKDLLRSRARGGATVFMSTHTLFVAEEIADCIGIIDHGRLLFLGGLEELRAVRSTSLEQFFLELTANGRAGEDPAPISISPLPPGEG